MTMSKLYFPILSEDILEIEKDWQVNLRYEFPQNSRFINRNLPFDIMYDDVMSISIPAGIKIVPHRYRIFPGYEHSNAIFKIIEIPDHVQFYWTMKNPKSKLRKGSKICVSINDLNNLEYKLSGKLSLK